MPVRPLLALVLGLCAAAGPAQAQRARVERRGPPEVAASPGEPLTLPFRVTNLSAAPASLPGRAELPAGWRAVPGGAPGELAPGEAELRLVGVGIPAGAAAGRHVVRYQAGGGADSAVLVVAERRRVRIEPLGAGGTAIAGTAYAVRFRVVNGGNVAERLALHAEGDQGIQPAPDSAALVLLPGGEAVVTVHGRTAAALARSLRHQVTLRAAPADGTAEARARTVVQVVPRGGARVRRSRLPAEVRVRAADSRSPAGLAFAAHGPLDAAGRTRLDVEARTADPPGTPFARQDEYRLRLAAPGVDVRLGDGVYALSRLTEPGRYGFGAGAEVTRGWVNAGGMASRDRRGEGRGGIAGGFVRVGTPRLRLGVAYARPDSVPARWTVQARVQPHRLLHAEAEAAPAAPDSVLPRSLQLRGTSRLLSYDLLHLRAGASYRGWGAADQDFGSLTLRPWGALALSASVRRGGQVRLLGDTSFFFRAYRRAGISWGSRFLLEARATDGDTLVRGDGRGVFGRVGVRLPLNGWLHPGLEVGTVVRTPGAAPLPYRIYSLQSTLSGRGASFWGTVQLRDGASAYAPGDREWSGALAGQLSLLPRTLLRVTGQGRRIGGGSLEGTLDAGLEQVLPGNHRVTLRALAAAQPLGGWRPRMYLEYGVPLGIPRPGRGEEHVVARVVDARTGRGMPDVFVRVGDRVALTDRRGEVVFAGLPAGTHLLRVEAGPGPEMVADRPLPLSVTVGAGGAARVQVGLEAAARLGGTVERVPAGADSAAVSPLAGVTVEITGPGGEHRAVTDAQGRFAITGVRSGWWRVRVDARSLPRHHALREEQRLLLQPGGSGDAWLRVVETERPVQMLQGGELAVP